VETLYLSARQTIQRGGNWRITDDMQKNTSAVTPPSKALPGLTSQVIASRTFDGDITVVPGCIEDANPE
jgi:hypothetical protein